MIIPIGHDTTISRFPYVTVGIMVVCLGVQLWVTIKAPSDEELAAIELQEQAVLRAAWHSEAGRRYLERQVPNVHQRPTSGSEMMQRMNAMRFARAKFERDFPAGKAVDPRDPSYLEWQGLQQRKSAVVKVLQLGYRPTQNKAYTLVTHTFVHGGWLHLIGNMLFLWLCGCNMEDRWGRLYWIGLYFGGGAVSALAFALVRGWHVEGPLIGASGAIAAAMGAFLVVCWDTTIRMFYFFWYRLRPISGTFEMKAYWALPLWFLQQVFGTMVEGPFVPVAYSAHVGGFVFGVAAALLMRATGLEQRVARAADAKQTVFAQHPLFLEAVAAREGGDPATARARLEQLVAQEPEHVDATIELFNLELAAGQGAAAARRASRAIVLCARAGDNAGLRQVYVDLRERSPEQALEPRALFAVAESFHGEEPARALEAYQQLVRAAPDDPVVPKALLRAAELYAGPLAEPLTAQRVLHQVREHFPGTPFAERAEQQLRELGQVG